MCLAKAVILKAHCLLEYEYKLTLVVDGEKKPARWRVVCLHSLLVHALALVKSKQSMPTIICVEISNCCPSLAITQMRIHIGLIFRSYRVALHPDTTVASMHAKDFFQGKPQSSKCMLYFRKLR